MAVHASHGALPYPIKGARYSMLVPFLDADGDPTDGTSLDTEISEDNGAFTDAAEEVSLASGSRGMGLITFSGAETDCSTLAVWFGASTAKATLATLYPRVLPTLESGTAQAGANGSITLASNAAAYDLSGCIVKTTGGTGGGGTGGANNQARVITAYNTSTKVATVVPNWETNPGNDTTYDILLTETGCNAAKANVTSYGGTAGTFSAGRPEVNTTHWAGTAVGSTTVRANLITVEGTDATDYFATLDDAVLSAIAALNNLSSAQAQTAAAAALTAYDPPTNAEMEARTLVAASYATAASLATVAADVWAVGTRTLTALDEDSTTLDLDATIRSAVGLAAANLDTQISTVDTVVDAIKVKTDSLTFTQAGSVDANIRRVNSVLVGGTGTVGDEWGP